MDLVTSECSDNLFFDIVITGIPNRKCKESFKCPNTKSGSTMLSI